MFHLFRFTDAWLPYGKPWQDDDMARVAARNAHRQTGIHYQVRDERGVVLYDSTRNDHVTAEEIGQMMEPEGT